MYCKSESIHNISDFIVKANPITMKPQIPGFGSHLQEMIFSSLLILISSSTSMWLGVQEPRGLPVSQIGGGGYLSPEGTQGTPTHCWWHQTQPLSPTSASLKDLRSSTDIPVGTDEQDYVQLREDVLGPFARSEIGDQAVFAGGFFRWLYPTGILLTPTFLSQIY